MTSNLALQERHSVFEAFGHRLAADDVISTLRDGLIGEDAVIPGPFGPQKLVYADYVASGRALRQVEDRILDQVLPYYANSHSETSYCGAYVTQLRAQARAIIAHLVGAGNDYAVIFAGSGATAGLNRLVHLYGVADLVREGQKVVVFIGPYEHHSNILPWREAGAEVVEIDEDAAGRPDVMQLEDRLSRMKGCALTIGAFSAASNVTGILADTEAITRVLKRHGALSIWDYAGGGPYLPIDMNSTGSPTKDAVVVSPHKFPGGPGASGIMVVRRDTVRSLTPTFPGGGSVSFVSQWRHDYLDSLEDREEAGTPNIIGDIRAALAFLVKDAVGQDFIDKRNAELVDRATTAWRRCSNLRILGDLSAPRLPIFSFHVVDAADRLVDYDLFTKRLSDRFGIQARGGCSCAGPYGHRLLGIDRARSDALRQEILTGDDSGKPGWVRLNFSYLFDDEKADYVIDSVARLAADMSGS